MSNHAIAALLTRTVDHAIEDGTIPAVHVGRRVLIPRRPREQGGPRLRVTYGEPEGSGGFGSGAGLFLNRNPLRTMIGMRTVYTVNLRSVCRAGVYSGLRTVWEGSSR